MPPLVMISEKSGQSTVQAGRCGSYAIVETSVFMMSLHRPNASSSFRISCSRQVFRVPWGRTAASNRPSALQWLPRRL